MSINDKEYLIYKLGFLCEEPEINHCHYYHNNRSDALNKYKIGLYKDTVVVIDNIYNEVQYLMKAIYYSGLEFFDQKFVLASDLILQTLSKNIEFTDEEFYKCLRMTKSPDPKILELLEMKLVTYKPDFNMLKFQYILQKLIWQKQQINAEGYIFLNDSKNGSFSPVTYRDGFCRYLCEYIESVYIKYKWNTIVHSFIAYFDMMSLDNVADLVSTLQK